MRILLGKTDLPVLKKAVKIIRKQARLTMKQTETLDGLSSSLGYLDYKQLSRLTTQDKALPAPCVTLDVIHEQITPWLENIINPVALNNDDYIQASLFIDKLNFKSFSILKSKSPKILIMDEFGMHYNSISKNQKEREIKLLREMGIPTYEWFCQTPSKLPTDKNIVLLKTLIDKTSLLLSNPIFSGLSHDDTLLFSAFKNKVLYEAIPESMISASDLTRSNIDKPIKPLGFSIIEGILNEKKIWSLYNDNLGAHLPIIFPSIYQAQYFQWQLASSGSIDVEAFMKSTGNDQGFDLTGVASFKIGSVKEQLITVRNGEMKENDFNQFLRTKNKYLNKVVIGKEFNDISIYEHSILDLNLPFIPPKEYLSPYNIPDFDSMTYPRIMNGNREALCHYSQMLGGIKKYSREYLVENDGTYDKALDFIESKIAYKESTDPYLNEYEPKELKESFPMLLERFTLEQVSLWHEEMIDNSGYRSNSSIHFNETALIENIFVKLIFLDENIACKEEHHHDVALVLFNEGISTKEIVSTLEKLVLCKKHFNQDINMISIAAYEFNLLGKESDVITKGEKRTIMSDMWRTGRKYGIKVTQSMSDFTKEPIIDGLNKMSVKYMGIKLHQDEQSDLRKLPPGYQFALKEVFEANNADFPYDVEQSKSSLNTIVDDYKKNDTKKIVSVAVDEVMKSLSSFNGLRISHIIGWLSSNNRDTSVNHLYDNPHYYVCTKKIEDYIFCYVSTYSEDVTTVIRDYKDVETAIKFKDHYCRDSGLITSEIDSKASKLLLSHLDKPFLAFGIIYQRNFT